MPAVKLAISEEGKESWREHLKELMEGKKTSLPEDFNPAIISVDYSDLFRQKLNTWDDYVSGYTIADKAADLVQAYGRMYDEIVRGHESGQREIYVETPGGEERARKLTLSEELACLDEAYQKYKGELEKIIEGLPESRAFREKQMEFAERIGEVWKKNQQAEKEEQEHHINDEVIPENIGERLDAAVQEIIAQYLSGSMKGISEIIANIKVF